MNLKLIIGPMFSGKTTALINEYNSLIEKHHSPNEILVINHSFDTRYSNTYLASHDNISEIKCDRTDNLMSITKEIINDKYTNILINEGQFFKDIHQWIKYLLVNNVHVNIVVSGLDSDYKQKPFNNFLNIIPYCDKIEKLTSTCNYCSQKTAQLTIRTSCHTERVIIGNEDIYKPICTYCLVNEKNKMSIKEKKEIMEAETIITLSEDKVKHLEAYCGKLYFQDLIPKTDPDMYVKEAVKAYNDNKTTFISTIESSSLGIDGWAEYWRNNKDKIRNKPTKSATKTISEYNERQENQSQLEELDDTSENIIISDVSVNTP